MKNEKNSRIQYKREKERECVKKEKVRNCREMRGLNSPVLIGRGRKGKPEKSTAGFSDFTPAASSTIATVAPEKHSQIQDGLA